MTSAPSRAVRLSAISARAIRPELDLFFAFARFATRRGVA
jgi:hypothetical protein